LLISRFAAYVWQSGRDAQYSATCGRMYLIICYHNLYPRYSQSQIQLWNNTCHAKRHHRVVSEADRRAM
ncbi:hypothetical protein K490DRAFT_43774, partial [Saccharata proteae CBS 121410]